MASYVNGSQVTSCTFNGQAVNKIIVDGIAVFINTYTVSFSNGTGYSSMYTSTNASATSGSPTGTPYEAGSTVYLFGVLSSNNYTGSGTVISGTGGTVGAIYRITSATINANYTFSTYNATAKTPATPDSATYSIVSTTTTRLRLEIYSYNNSNFSVNRKITAYGMSGQVIGTAKTSAGTVSANDGSSAIVNLTVTGKTLPAYVNVYHQNPSDSSKESWVEATLAS